jgi:hypothetical protein
MNELFNRMKTGTIRQRAAWETTLKLAILGDLKEYDPVLCGTVPIGIDMPDSDLDLIVEVKDLEKCEILLKQLYGGRENFILKRTSIRGQEVVKANFLFDEFEFEVFGQNIPVHQQHAYLHMMIEHHILEENHQIKERVVKLKQSGIKTEPAFCEVLGIKGDPYSELIHYGREKGFIPAIK